MRLKRLVVATIVALFLLPAVSASAISTNRIEAVSFSSPTTGYLVGGYSPNTGFVSVTTDGGMTWSTSAPVPGEWFKSVAAGPSGALAFPEFKRYSYGTAGATVTLTKRGDIAGAGPRIADVAVLSGGRVAAVGENVGAPNTGNPALIVTSNDNGTTWASRYEGPSYQPAPGSEDEWVPTRAGLTAIDTAGDGTVAFAVGNEYNAPLSGETSFIAIQRWLIYKTTDGGTSWSLQTAPPTTRYPINSVAMANSNVAYAAGGNRLLLKTVDGGATWNNITFLRKDTFTSFNANDIAAVDAQTIVAVGDAGIIYKSTDGGATTANITYTRLPANPALRDVEVLDANTWIAVGDDRAIYRTTNAGASWSAASAPATPDPIGGSTSLTSWSSASVIAYGGSTTISGKLIGPLGPVAGQTVEVWSRSYLSGSAWKKSSALRTTLADGSVSWTAKPKVRTYYQIRYPGAGGYSASTGAAQLISPKVSLTAPRNGSAVKRGRVYTWYGYLKPKHTTGSSVARLQFQRKVGGVYKPYKTLTAKGYYASSLTTKYSLRTSLPTKGMWRVRAYHKDAGHHLTYSGWLYKNVK